jgi:hypothetical protein
MVPETEATKVTVTHDEWAENDPTYTACADGWPRILSCLKTLIEPERHSNHTDPGWGDLKPFRSLVCLNRVRDKRGNRTSRILTRQNVCLHRTSGPE